MATLEVHRVPVLQDNYVWLAHEVTANVTAAVDPAVSHVSLSQSFRVRLSAPRNDLYVFCHSGTWVAGARNFCLSLSCDEQY